MKAGSEVRLVQFKNTTAKNNHSYKLCHVHFDHRGMPFHYIPVDVEGESISCVIGLLCDYITAAVKKPLKASDIMKDRRK